MTRTNARRMMGIAAFVMLSIAGAAGQSTNAPAAGFRSSRSAARAARVCASRWPAVARGGPANGCRPP